MNNDEFKALYNKVKYIPEKGTKITYPKEFSLEIKGQKNKVKTLVKTKK